MKKFFDLSFLLTSGLLFGVWIVWSFFPEKAMTFFEVSPNNNAGMNALKSDLAGVFLSLSLFFGLAFFHSKKWLYAALGLTACILFGRVLSLLIDGASAYAMISISAEVFGIAVIVFYLKMYPIEKA